MYYKIARLQQHRLLLQAHNGKAHHCGEVQSDRQSDTILLSAPGLSRGSVTEVGIGIEAVAGMGAGARLVVTTLTIAIARPEEMAELMPLLTSTGIALITGFRPGLLDLMKTWDQGCVKDYNRHLWRSWTASRLAWSCRTAPS